MVSTQELQLGHRPTLPRRRAAVTRVSTPSRRPGQALADPVPDDEARQDQPYAGHQARYTDLGPDHYTTKIDKNRTARSHIRQLQALGYTVTLTQAA
jgi:hypothetical protein